MFLTPGWDQRNQYQVAVSGLGGGRKSSFVTGGESCEETLPEAQRTQGIESYRIETKSNLYPF